MGWGKRAGFVASALAIAAAGGAALGLTSTPSTSPTASAGRTAAARLAGGVTHSVQRHAPRDALRSRADDPAPAPATTAPPTTVPPTTVPPPTPPPTTVPPTTLPGPAYLNASPKNPYVAALAARLAPVVHTAPGCVLVTQGKTVLYDSHPAEPVAPGSTEKLLVAAAALDVLGPDYTFTTEVVAPSAPVNGAVSSLWLVGGGDPVLEEPAFNAWWVAQPRYRGDPFTNIDTLAAEVRAKGVTTVTGAVYGDDARYDGVRENPHWPAYTEADGDIAQISALTLDLGYQAFAANAALVSGNPASFAAASFAQLLTTAGVKDPDNPPGGDSAPPAGSVVIAAIKSPPLWQIVGAMLRPSDNQIAELLVKELGYHATGLGTTAAGLAVVKSVDTRLGIPWEGTVMYDGSGLSHEDRTTCETLLAAFYLGDKPGFSELREGLSIAGVNGTLALRFTTGPLYGHIRAKTGSIDGAASMVGEVDLAEPVRFALVFNQPVPDYALLNDEDKAIDAIAPYP